MAHSNPPVAVLFVCMGNICRSPTAEGLFRKVVGDAGLGSRFTIDSAGAHAYHVGESPDRRSQQEARKHGIDLSNQRARKIAAKDFEAFDYICTMDDGNYDDVMRVCPPEHAGKVRRFTEFAPELGVDEVPDPYYGGGRGFENVLEICRACSEGLLAAIRKERGL